MKSEVTKLELLAVLLVRDERCADENLTTYPPILQDKKRNKKILTGLWSAKELATSSKVKKTRVSILDLLSTADKILGKLHK